MLNTNLNINLNRSKREKNDEFYTQYSDIENEITAYVEYNPNVFRGKTVYCNCIEVSFTDAIPSDYSGIMGVPVSFLDKYNPEQFEIVGLSRHNNQNMDGGFWKGGKKDATLNGKQVYKRILIKHKQNHG